MVWIQIQCNSPMSTCVIMLEGFRCVTEYLPPLSCPFFLPLGRLRWCNRSELARIITGAPFVGCRNAEQANNDMRVIASVLGLSFPAVESHLSSYGQFVTFL